MSFWGELKRRNVVKVGAAYLAVVWLVLQVGAIVLPAFGFSSRAMQMLIFAFALGFPIVLVCAWVYELTPEGPRRTEDVSADNNGALRVGRRLDFAIIALLSLALITVVVDQYLIEDYSASSLSSIAVLPLTNLSGDPEQEYFADGMTDALIANLAKISALRVISRTSSMRFKYSDMSLPEIAAELGVAAVVEGSATRVGQTVRITAQLVDAATDQNLWSETFDRDFDDVLTMQANIAREIAEQIRITVTPEEEILLADPGPVDTVAYDAFLKGTLHFYRLTPTDLDLAEDYFEAALEADQSSALAHAGIAMVWTGRMQMGFVPATVAGPIAKASALRALAIDARLAEVHFGLATVSTWSEWDFDAAEEHFRRAIELKPGYPDAPALYSHYLINVGRFDEALAQIERAIDLDPFNPFFRALYGVVLHFARRDDEAVVQLDLALEAVPNLPFALQMLTSSLHALGRYDEAVTAQQTLIATFGDREAVVAIDAAFAEGGYVQAMQQIADWTAERSLAVGASAIWVALRYYYAGNEEKTIEWMERAYEQRDPNTPYLRNPDFDGVREDPRVQDLMRRIGL
jgi:TolB-like protein/Tfp pilus assembly protein PilF